MPGSLLNILLVEDNSNDVDLLHEAVTRSNLSIALDVAPDGQEALDYLLRGTETTQARPDLILLDLNLPRKNGQEVLRELKQHQTLQLIPVVVFSTSNTESDIMVSYQL